MEVWIRFTLRNDNIRVDGVFSSKTKALDRGGPSTVAAPAELDHDYGDETEFTLYSQNCPNGVRTGGVLGQGIKPASDARL